MTNGAHTNGNILTKKLNYKNNFGTNGLTGEISYIRSFESIAAGMMCGDGSDDILVLGKDIDVKPGQSATVVITAETRKDVLLLPLSVIAGRQGKGMVTVINDGKQIQTEVMLGATDGAYIEILSGVNEGDTISSIPPNLDPRSKE